MASHPLLQTQSGPVGARLLTGLLFVGCLPHALLTRHSPGSALDTAREVIAHIYSLPG